MEKLPVILAERGVGDLDVTFSPRKHFTLVFLRCHFSADPACEAPATDPAVMTVDLDSHLGYEHDTRLYTLEKNGGVGFGRDAQIVVTDEGRTRISPWSFHAEDALRMRWQNPGGVQWGLTLGIAPIQ